jgi:hypothetical protein
MFTLDAKHRFSKVVDIWQFGWNTAIGTVHPAMVTHVALSYIKKYPKKRFILHYLQPHAPYLSQQYTYDGFPAPDLQQGQILTGLQNINPKLTNIVRDLTFVLEKINFNLGLGNLYTVKIKKLLHFPPIDPMDATIRRYGISGLRKAYLDNLNMVLRYIALLASQLTRNIVITSDHGEFLGEKQRFGHPCDCSDPIVRTIPWFHIDQIIHHFTHKEVLRHKIFRLKQSKWSLKNITIR